MWRFATKRSERTVSVGAPAPNHQEGKDFPMAKYSRSDIEALSQRLETRASVMSNEAGRDLKSAALLLRLMSALAEIEGVETGPLTQQH
jgi:hypothetical protein